MYNIDIYLGYGFCISLRIIAFRLKIIQKFALCVPLLDKKGRTTFVFLFFFFALPRLLIRVRVCLCCLCVSVCKTRLRFKFNYKIYSMYIFLDLQWFFLLSPTLNYLLFSFALFIFTFFFFFVLLPSKLLNGNSLFAFHLISAVSFFTQFNFVSCLLPISSFIYC